MGSILKNQRIKAFKDITFSRNFANEFINEQGSGAVLTRETMTNFWIKRKMKRFQMTRTHIVTSFKATLSRLKYILSVWLLACYVCASLSCISSRKMLKLVKARKYHLSGKMTNASFTFNSRIAALISGHPVQKSIAIHFHPCNPVFRPQNTCSILFLGSFYQMYLYICWHFAK